LLPKSTVYECFAQWRGDGTWQRVLDALRTQVRVNAGREPTPSAACIDSQSVKITEIGGDQRGYDGGKKLNGRKRHLLMDTLGLLIVAVVTRANLDDGWHGRPARAGPRRAGAQTPGRGAHECTNLGKAARDATAKTTNASSNRAKPCCPQRWSSATPPLGTVRQRPKVPRSPTNVRRVKTYENRNNLFG
jgi:transposase